MSLALVEKKGNFSNKILSRDILRYWPSTDFKSISWRERESLVSLEFSRAVSVLLISLDWPFNAVEKLYKTLGRFLGIKNPGGMFKSGFRWISNCLSSLELLLCWRLSSGFVLARALKP